MRRFFQLIFFHDVVTFLKQVVLNAGALITGDVTITGNLNVTGAIGASGTTNGLKRWVAKLNQTAISTTSGALVEGNVYVINTLKVDDDFANVGYVEEGTPFEATGTTPTHWAHSTVVINLTDSVPVATVLQNTLGGDIVVERSEVGVYTLSLDGAFPELLCIALIPNPYNLVDPDNNTIQLKRNTDNSLVLRTFTNQDFSTPSDFVLEDTPIVIEVYDPIPAIA